MSKLIKPLCVVASLLAASTASADTLNVPQIQLAGTIKQNYQCDGGKSLQVTYLNATNGQSFALLAVEGKPLLFVDTIAASGVRYQAGRYVWWSKGNNGDLYDAMQGVGAAPIVAGCSASP
ncbi:MliC family protein [Dyella humicola]|uniref:MliC family protein n=1 Tax=Dyella humicola TaxID=2992126 RepID=UPI00225BF37D|nr:MliC family protein [Dyella humicola]